MATSKGFSCVFAMVVTFSISLSVQATRPTSAFLLWAGGAPGALGSASKDKPSLTPYFASGTNATRAAMIVCPGGGYSYLESAKEGSYFAQWLNELGISAFVLKYRLGPDGYHHPVQMWDAQRAIRYVRANALDWGLSPNRIGIIGASAGGHLASTALVHFDDGNPDSPDPIEQVSCRPDFGVLCYPVITMKTPYTHIGSRNNLLGSQVTNSVLVEYLSSELQVTSNTPPSFLMHMVTDTTVPYQNSTMFADALASNSVPYELHLYSSGNHGVGLGYGGVVPGNTASYHPWTAACAQWLGPRVSSIASESIGIAGGMVSLTASGGIGADYSLWTTTNLALNSWTPLTNGTISGSPFAITDSPTNPRQFYQFRAP